MHYFNVYNTFKTCSYLKHTIYQNPIIFIFKRKQKYRDVQSLIQAPILLQITATYKVPNHSHGSRKKYH